MKPILIFRHLDCEGPGYLAEFLFKKNIPFQLLAIDAGEAVPSSINQAGGLVFMGGPMSVNDDLPWIEQELVLIRQAKIHKLPVLGHCLGGQLIAKALDAEVSPNKVKEIGWHNVECIRSPATQPWLKDLPEHFQAFHWHGETFSLPTGASPLLTNQWCTHQAFVYDNMLALQCHVEMTPEMVQEWCIRHQHEIAQPTQSVQDAQQITTSLPQKTAELQRHADILYQRWIVPILMAND